MLQLLYPSGKTPVLPSPRAYMVDTNDSAPAEILPVVEPSGEVVAQSDRSYIHSGSFLLHPVVHLHVINHWGDVFLQRRSASKKLLPLYWDTAVGGHVSYGESIVEALFREASEELSFTDFNPVFVEAYQYESMTEKELVSVFVAIGEFDLHPFNDEVTEGRYWTSAQIESAKGKGILTPNFEYEYSRFKDKFEALL